MAYKRADRVNALLQRELGMIISEELRDPRIAFATVTGVEITSDLRTAKVHVSVLGDEEQVKSTLIALNEARPYLRHEIGARTELRFVPELTSLSSSEIHAPPPMKNYPPPIVDHAIARTKTLAMFKASRD